jgi:hypothetical protein
LKISKEKVRKITNEIRRKRKAATTRGITRYRSKRFKQDDKPDPDVQSERGAVKVIYDSSS